MRNIWLLFFVLSIMLLSGSTVLAFNDDADLSPSGDATKKPLSGSFYVELGGANDPDAIGGSIGVTADASDYFTWSGGVTYFASEHSSDLFGGLSLGLRTKATKYRVMPFVGIGVFSGISKENVLADDDGEDNDGDGETDEAGEEDEIIDDVLCSVYPEIGLNVMLSDNSGVMLTAKHHFTTEGRDYQFWMYSMVVSVYF